jgi:cbb3-type cytochrome oxidase maturation protein
MDSLYLLLPLSVVLVLALIALFAWALKSGQFDDLEREGWRVLEESDSAVASAPPNGVGVDTSHNLDNAQSSSNPPSGESGHQPSEGGENHG